MSAAAETRRPGRPSLAGERRAQVLDAFLTLVGEHGLEAVTLDRVAQAAGVQRPVIRHFVGNRADLVRQAIGRLSEWYEAEVRTAVGAAPNVDALLDLLFGDTWTQGLSAHDRAFDALLLEATRDAGTAAAVRRAYAMLLDEVAAALQRESPRAGESLVRDTAYAVVCLAEHNATMIALGHPPALAAAARRAAAVLTDGVRAAGPATSSAPDDG
ncbi:MAG: TetR/AcrR family transcriptional regulator [Kineosporiaceae bacterium]